MRVLDIIRQRQSVRKYLPRVVEEAKIDNMLEAARLAPSSTNSQPWHFVVVKDRDLIKRIANSVVMGVAVINKWMEEAPVVIVGCVRPTLVQRIVSLFGRYNHVIDLSIAMEHMVLVAQEEGLGTCWVGWFDERKVRQILKVPFGSKIVAMLTLGYAAPDGTHPTTRKPIQEIYSVNVYKG